MTLNLNDFGKFKIVQDDGNWVDRERIVPVINYWKHYFDHMFVSGTVVHNPGDKPNVQYDRSPKKIVIKGHTCINSLAIMFAALERNHTVYFDDSTNLSESWYSKVKPDILLVGNDDLVFAGSRYVSGPNCIRLLFTRQMTNMFEYDDYVEVDPKSVWIEHQAKKKTKFTTEKIKQQFEKFEGSPAVAYVEQDSRHQVKQLVEFILPLMYSYFHRYNGPKEFMADSTDDYTNCLRFMKAVDKIRTLCSSTKLIETCIPDVVWWGVKLEKMLEDYDPWLNTLSPTPYYVPHVRKQKVVETKTLPDFIKESDSV